MSSSKKAKTCHGASSNRGRQGKPLPPSLPHQLNHWNIQFSGDEQRTKYDTLVSRQISVPRYLDEGALVALGLWDDVRSLLENLGWLDFINLKCPVYERLVWEFLSSLHVDWIGNYDNGPVHIQFRFFNKTYDINLATFNTLLCLTPGGLMGLDHPKFDASKMWRNITCTSVDYDSRKSKATLICNPNFRYLQRFMANTIFGRGDSQNVVRRGELFLIWAAVKRNEVDTGAIILAHILNSVRDARHVIGVGGTITALALGLNLGDQVDKLPIKFGGGRLDLLSCIRIGLVSPNAGQYTLSAHGTSLFFLPNPIKTTLANKSNWTCDNENKSKGDDKEESEEPMDCSKTTKANKPNWTCDNENKSKGDDKEESEEPMDCSKTTKDNKPNWICDNEIKAEGDDAGESEQPMDGSKTATVNRSNRTHHSVTNAEDNDEEQSEPMDKQLPQPSADIVEPSRQSQRGVDLDMYQSLATLSVGVLQIQSEQRNLSERVHRMDSCVCKISTSVTSLEATMRSQQEMLQSQQEMLRSQQDLIHRMYYANPNLHRTGSLMALNPDGPH